MNVRQLTGFMDSMMNVIIINCGIISLGKRRFNVKMWRTFTDVFNCLPVAALIDDKILCMHGGLRFFNNKLFYKVQN